METIVERWRNRTAILLMLLLALCAPAAFGQLPATLNPKSPARPGDVDLSRSMVFVRIGATGLGHEHGAEGLLSAGRVLLGARENAGQLVFDLASFAAETARARKVVGLNAETNASTAQQVTANMRGPDVLNIDKFPQAIFVITSALPAGQPRAGQPPQYVLDGKFTLHGVTQPLRITATAEEAGGMVHLRGEFTLLQSKFSIKPYTKAFGAIGVADEVKVLGDLWVHSAAPTK